MIKEETLEKAAEIYDGNYASSGIKSFIAGAKWQQERSYSEEEVLTLLEDRSFHCCGATKMSYITTEEWFKQFKKK